MAKYGAKYIQFAPFAETAPDDSDTAYPEYGTPVNIGKLQKATDYPSYNDVKIYGDDMVAENVVEFKEATLDVEVTELAPATASAVFGASLSTSESDTDLKFGSSDNAPFGGAAFYTRKIVNNLQKYQGVYYPKVKAIVQGAEYSTKGDSITLTGDKLKFNVFAPKNGGWKVMSNDITTEAAAKAWVDAKFVAAT